MAIAAPLVAFLRRKRGHSLTNGAAAKIVIPPPLI